MVVPFAGCWKTKKLHCDRVKQEDEDGDASGTCPYSPGDIVAGVVSAAQGTDGIVAVDLPAAAPHEDNKDKGSSRTDPASRKPIRGFLPYAHLGDHASLCNETLAARLTPGTSIEQLLVVEVDKQGVPIVSLKPLLLSAASLSKGGTGKEAFIPQESSDVSLGDVVAGFVSRVEAFGVFVKFLGRFSALCPRSMVADRTVEDPRGMFQEGDSVR